MSEASARGGRDLGAWWMLAVLWVLYSFSYLDRYVLTMLVDAIKADLGLTDFQMSLILGPAFAASYALVTLPVGWAVDRFERRVVAFGGVFVWSTATVASGLARAFAPLFAARIFVAAGEAALTPTAFSLIADRFPRAKLTTAFAIFQSGVKVGSAAAFGVGGVLLALSTEIGRSGALGSDLQPWHLVMIMVGAPGFLLAPFLFSFREPRRAAPAGQPREQAALWPFVVANRKVLSRLLGGFSVVTICPGALVAWTPTYLGRHFHWTPLQYGAALSAISILAAVTLVVKGGIVDWLFARGMKDAHIRFYCWLLAGSLPIALGAFFVENPYVFLGLYGFLQLVTIPFLVYANAALSVIVPPALRGRVAAITLVTLNVIGPGLGPLVVGALTDFVFRDETRLGHSLALTLGVCMPVALLLLWSSLRDLRRAVGEAEARTAAASTGRPLETRP
jgi:MFS family permease